MRSIIAVTDLGQAGGHAVRLGIDLALEAGAELHVVHGMDLIGLSLREVFVALYAGAAQSARVALDAQVSDLGAGAPMRINSILDPRSGKRVVAELVPDLGAGLVIIGFDPEAERAHSRTTKLALEIVATSGAPVLMTGGALDWPPRHVRRLGDDRGAGRGEADASRADASLSPSEELLAMGVHAAPPSFFVGRWLDSGGDRDLLLIPQTMIQEFTETASRTFYLTAAADGLEDWDADRARQIQPPAAPNEPGDVAETLTAELERLIEELTIHIPNRFGSDPAAEAYAELVAHQAETRKRIRQIQEMMAGRPVLPTGLMLPDGA